MSKKKEGFLSSPEASKYLKMPNKSLRNLCLTGKIKHATEGKFGNGRRLYFKIQWLDDYQKQQNKTLVIVEAK